MYSSRYDLSGSRNVIDHVIIYIHLHSSNKIDSKKLKKTSICKQIYKNIIRFPIYNFLYRCSNSADRTTARSMITYWHGTFILSVCSAFCGWCWAVCVIKQLSPNQTSHLK